MKCIENGQADTLLSDSQERASNTLSLTTMQVFNLQISRICSKIAPPRTVDKLLETKRTDTDNNVSCESTSCTFG